VDVRVVAATNRQLEEAVRAGTFRDDLYFRLHIFPIHLPPLRERLEDLPALVRHLAARARPAAPQSYQPDALAQLAAYHWPGNIRELENVVERLAILAGPTVGPTTGQILTRRPRARDPGVGGGARRASLTRRSTGPSRSSRRTSAEVRATPDRGHLQTDGRTCTAG
jgi:transcriptional regulator with GAF, ATPase, and Fis domain